jgi:hypothetical protein
MYCYHHTWECTLHNARQNNKARQNEHKGRFDTTTTTTLMEKLLKIPRRMYNISTTIIGEILMKAPNHHKARQNEHKGRFATTSTIIVELLKNAPRMYNKTTTIMGKLLKNAPKHHKKHYNYVIFKRRFGTYHQNKYFRITYKCTRNVQKKRPLKNAPHHHKKHYRYGIFTYYLQTTSTKERFTLKAKQ